MDKVIQFAGETNWDAVINSASLNIEEEEAFLEFCQDKNIDRDDDAETLGRALQRWFAFTKQNAKEVLAEKADLMGMEPNPVPIMVTSFADLDAVEQAAEMAHDMKALTVKFAEMAENIFMVDDIEDKAAALEALASEFSERVSTVSSKEKWQPLTNATKRLIKKIRGDEDEERKGIPDSIKELGFHVWKEADDSYRWLARYSNNYRDEDSPPEIIAAKSHERFVEMVDREEVELPELWLWHVPQWRWGQAQVVAYDDAGFAIAAGTVDDTKEARDIAETIMALPQDSFLVSHGMPVDKIVRDEDDPSIIIQHVTKEISPLPAWAAANKLTGFTILKEASMAIPDEKRTELQETGVSADLLDALEAVNAGTAKEADAADIESKEAGEEEAPQPEAEQQAEPVPVSRDELAQVFTQIGETFQALTEQVGELATEVKALKETRAVEEEISLEDLFTRAAGHSDARVDGRTKEGKSRPKETPPEGSETPEVVSTMRNPVMAETINQLLAGDWLEGVREHTTGGH